MGNYSPIDSQPPDEFGTKNPEKPKYSSSSSSFHRAGTLTKLPSITGEFALVYRQDQPCHGKNITVQVYSETMSPSTGRGKLSEKAKLVYRRTEEDLKFYKIKLYIEEDFGVPAAFDIENKDKYNFFLVYATISAAGYMNRYFNCNSWVYSKTQQSRIFFANTCYLPTETPPALKELRDEELSNLSSFRSTIERKESDRAYEYDCYDDLGIHDGISRDHDRPKLGNSNLPYPRRIKTGHRPSKLDKDRTIFETYVPPDERLSIKKQKELILNIIKVTIHFIIPLQPNTSQSFESFDEIRLMYTKFTEEDWKKKTKRQEEIADRALRKRQSDGMISLLAGKITERIDKIIEIASKPRYEISKCMKAKEVDKRAREILKRIVPNQYKKEITHLSSEARQSFLIPQIIIENPDAWKDDKEFARQMIAGTNPTQIQSLKKKKETETNEILKWAFQNPSHCGVQKYLEEDRLYILDHHEYLMPFLLEKINSTGIHAYASRTILLRGGNGTLEPIAIELCLPTDKSKRVFYPLPLGVDKKDKKNEALWQLAKAHVAANDCVYHQLISHWLHTHAVVEPFIIATRRRLSVMHPIHRLLHPHFKDTLHINALARGILLNSGGIFEKILFTGKFSMELSSELYKAWKFDKQALPEDLKARGMAKVPATNSTDDVELVFEDYPYGADGLKIWMAIKSWVKDFISCFYMTDKAVTDDHELKNWWQEIQTKGHPEKKDGWYDLTTIQYLTNALTTLIWITSGLHASVNFGQYAYAGYPPNRPTLCRKPIPKEGSMELDELVRNPDKFLLNMLPKKLEAAIAISLMHVLSCHTEQEVYLGCSESENWIDNTKVIERFKDFRKSLKEIERDILQKNRGKLPVQEKEKGVQQDQGKLPVQEKEKGVQQDQGNLPVQEKEKEVQQDQGNLPVQENREKFPNRWGPAKIPYKLLCPDTSEIGSAKGVTGRGIPNSISI